MWFVRHARLWLALLAEILLLAALHRFDDWRYASMPVKFVETAVLSGIAFFAAASFFGQLEAGRRVTIVFWSVALLLRFVALPLEPGDDLWRYQWEGKVQNAGFNPYVLAPNDEQLTPLRAQFSAWSQINHRDYSAIYPPGMELIFAGLSRLSASAIVYKLLFAAADLAAIALLLLLIGGRTRHADAAWYAWNPLVAYSFAGAAHFDSLMILPMLGGILCFVRSRSAADSAGQWRWAVFGAVAFGAAISIKLVPVLLLPVCVFGLGRRAWVLAVSLGVPALLSLPFGFPGVPIWKSLGRFIYVARLNDMFWWIVEDTFWPNPHQKNYHYNVIIILAVSGGFAFLHLELEARLALGDGDGAHPEPGAAPLVLHVDFALGRLATSRCLAGALGHDFRLLPLLERAALHSSVALRAVAARVHPHTADRGRAPCLPAQVSA